MDKNPITKEGFKKNNEDRMILNENKNKLNFKTELLTNIAEKIVICIDVSDEMSKYFFSLKDAQAGQGFRDYISRALIIFMRTKVSLNTNHQFAILLFANSAFWVSNFTRDLEELIEIVKTLPSLPTDNTLDISILFDSLLSNVHLDSSHNPSSHVYRTILIYGRHFCLPTFDHNKYRSFKESDNFIIDVLYLYNPETNDNHCEEIFESFCQLDFHGTSYIMAASEGAEVMQGLAQMLGNPLQRPPQKEVSLALNPLIHA